MSTEFEPKILGILCNWCSYTGHDLAGVGRIKCPANVKVVRVMCSGRVDPTFVLKAFQEGADGVLVSGCHPGECHYVDGNIKAMRRAPLMTELLKQLGIEEERYKLVWCSAAEGDKFARIVAGMVADLKKLGPYRREEGVRKHA